MPLSMNPYLPFLLAVTFTLTVSAFCSLLEAMILSTTTAEIEALKQRNPRLGKLLESYREELEQTSSAILSLNTVANTLGATVSGVMAARIWGGETLIATYLVPGLLTLGILLLSEILPKNAGVLYRPTLQPIMVMPLAAVRWLMWPISRMAGSIVRALPTHGIDDEESADEAEIKLLAEKSAEVGNLSAAESAIISGALSLDEIRIYDIMTPRTVVKALEKTETIGDIFASQGNIPFARIPVYEESIDTIVGLVRRRDLLKAKAEDKDTTQVADLMQDVIFVPDTANGAQALEQLIRYHQQLGVAVDEYGSVSGVITMEDIVEHILGQEIFERDDPAVDMRELARSRERVRARKKARETAK